MRMNGCSIFPHGFISKCQVAGPGTEARERGVALVLILLVITILCVMVVEFNYLMRVDITIAANIRDENRALYIAKAGVNAAVAILKKDDNDYDDDGILKDHVKDKYADEHSEVDYLSENENSDEDY